MGRAFTKHSRRNNGEARWGKVQGSNQDINATGLRHFTDILEGSGTFTPDRWRGKDTLIKRIPDGRGVRIEKDGTFIGFLDPPL